MRFDLTHASYRVLQRASKRYLPNTPSEITAVKLLIALFEEEECRAVDWLSQAGLSLAMFADDFALSELIPENRDISGDTAILRSPISAPGFPVGSYGVPPESLQGGSYASSPRQIETDQMQDNYYSSGATPERKDQGEQGEDHSPDSGDRPLPRPALPPDDWTPSSPEDDLSFQRRRYSAFSDYSPQTYVLNSRSQALFYLDDQAVSIGHLSRELETSLEITASQVGKRSEERRRLPTHGGVLTVLSQDADFRASLQPLATEHLLLATAFDESDVGVWLRERGFDPTTLFDRIDKLGEKRAAISPEGTSGVLSGEEFDRPEMSEPAVRDDRSQRLKSNEEGHCVDRQKLYRLIDAAANRAREALRVVEDFVRFLLDDGELTSRLKFFRHELHEILLPFSPELRLEARNTDGDVGTRLEGSVEYDRKEPSDVLAANFSRLQESLRSLEEFSKIEKPPSARRLEQLRYESYTLHKLIGLGSAAFGGAPDDIPDSQTDSVSPDAGCSAKVAEEETGTVLPGKSAVLSERAAKLAAARLYALLDCRENEAEFIRLANELIAGGVDVVQLRDKKANDRTLLERGNVLRRLLTAKPNSDRGSEHPETETSHEKYPLLIVNDRPDLAMLLEADGVHVGQDELTVEDVRRIVGPDVLVGVSTHDIDQARRAVSDGADYLGAGPVFASTTKDFTEIYSTLPGPEFLKQMTSEISIPVFAIGGITPDNLDRVLLGGVDRIAVGAALLDSAEPRETVRAFAKRLGEPEKIPTTGNESNG